ncbi:MAG: right-handed parallel beta-helix repeat-containing protein, partial [Xanthobacteraceae bacterium]
MRKIALSLAILGATLVSVLYTAPAHAQATRTWVSGVGDDANPCSRTAPCKTWAGAISKTAAGGEIDNLDTGGYGGLTITKSITLDGGDAQVASVLVSGTNGITIAAGATDVVILRNLQFQGLLGNGSSSGTAGLTGIKITSGATVSIEHVKVMGFSGAGISDARTGGGTKLFVRDTIVENCAGTGIAAVAGATNTV